MPTISRFYGITIRMYFLAAEHNPPHIHAKYGKEFAIIGIKTGSIIAGSLPKNALSMVLEWMDLHKDELIAMWETQDFRKLPPLL